GFEEKAFNVSITDGSAAEVDVVFDTSIPRPDGIAHIETIPAGASIYLDGEKIGITPADIQDLNTGEPVKVTVKLDGYQEVILQDEFPPGEREVTLEATLQEVMARGRLRVTSKPPGATLYVGNRKVGVTPKTVEDLDPTETHEIELTKDGYKPKKVSYQFNGELDVEKEYELTPLRIAQRQNKVVRANPGKKPSGGKSRPSGGKCSGNEGTFSAMVLGEPGCTIKIGGRTTYKPPFFKKKVPVGRCPIVVSCPSGKSFTETRTLKNGDNGKLIVKPAMLK
ncbi:MAG: PEGA domain-containing protein, partial [Myxococcota bacterium]